MASTSIRLPSARYLVVALVVLVSTHYIVSYSSPTYASNTSLDSVKSQFSTSRWAAAAVEKSAALRPPSLTPVRPQSHEFDSLRLDDESLIATGSKDRRANAAFVILARNSDIWEILASIRGMEGTLLVIRMGSVPRLWSTDDLFLISSRAICSDRFNHKYNYPYVFLNDQIFTEDFKKRTSALASGKCTYGLIPDEQWLEPKWIDQSKAATSRAAMEKANVIYGGSETYRRMCR